MSASFLASLHSLIAFLAFHSWIAFTLFVSVQAVLITLAATLLAKVCKSDSAWSHRIWLSAVSLMLLVMPLHGLTRVWTIGVNQSNKVSRTSTMEQATVRIETGLLAEDHTSRKGVRFADQPITASQFFDDATIRGENVNLNQLKLTESTTDRPQNESNEASRNQSLNVPAYVLVLQLVVGVYLAGVIIMLSRLAFGVWKLQSLARGGRDLSARSNLIVEHSAIQMRLQSTPEVKSVDGLNMPLTFGILRAVVLVPTSFDSWTDAEKRAVALHELTHIKRHDVLGELAARVMQAVYWFHPASLYLARKLKMAREFATDVCVVRSGEDPLLYARSLIAILARVNAELNSQQLHSSLVVAMSIKGDVEPRLQNILSTNLNVVSRKKGSLIVATLIAIAVLTTFRLELVSAQPPTKSTQVSQSAKASEKEPDQNTSDEADSDLFSRIKNCTVLTVTGNEYSNIMDVSGQVIGPGGEPVAGAFVLLRESSTARISSEPQKYIEREDRHLVRVDDVFARTITDTDGTFRFKNVKSPAMRKGWSNEWRGDVVAGHHKLGIGWQLLPSKKERRRSDSGVTIRLFRVNTISGRYATPTDESLVGAAVNLHGLDHPSIDSYSLRDNKLDLQASQLTPRAKTDSAGRFTFSSIPQGFAATIGAANHDGWLGVFATVATSDDVQLGNRGGPINSPYPKTLVGSPVSLVADRGLKITGVFVDDSGMPVTDASVSIASSVTNFPCNEKGEFLMHLPTAITDQSRQRNENVVNLFVRVPKGSELLMQYVNVPIEELQAEKPLKITLQRGVKVSGKVVTSDSSPAADILVQQVGNPYTAPSSAVTNANGEYGMFLVRGKHILVAGTDEPGYQLPSQRDARFANEEQALNWPRRIVDVSDGGAQVLEPIVVTRMAELQVTVSLAGGQPAVGASVVITDEMLLQSNSKMPRYPLMPSFKKEISKSVETDGAGRASLLPQGAPTSAAKVEVKLVSDNKSFHGMAILSDAKDGVVQVVLQGGWLLQGRVLLDGKPLAGARVSVGESTPISTANAGGRMSNGFSVSNQQTAISDADGVYRLAVKADQEYNVMILSIPGQQDSSGIGYRPTKAGDGLLEVKDFEFFTGTEEIAGYVVDHGKPIAGANVSVSQTINSNPSLWIGHRSESQSTTDATGRFHLKNVPFGSYQLRVSGPREQGQIPNTTVVDASTGDMNKIISIDSRQPPSIPRLQPKSIQKAKQP